MSDIDQGSDVAALTVQLLSAYLSNNTVSSEDLAELIRSTKAALTQDAEPVVAPAEPEAFTPAVSARKSLASPDQIISLIDGKPYKTLKRHLASHGLTPETYRSRYNLPVTYPMVAPTYAAHRRAVAQKIGLGSRRPAAESVADAIAPALESFPEAPVLPSSEPSEPKPRRSRQNAAPAAAKGTTRGRKKKAEPVNQHGLADAAQDEAPVTAASPQAEPSAPAAAERTAPKPGKAAGKAKATKPRGKIGLFKAAVGDDGAPSVSDDLPQTEAASDMDQSPAEKPQPEAQAATKPAKPKRMARAPKPEAK
jgi:predicted transcriptional regulator